MKIGFARRCLARSALVAGVLAAAVTIGQFGDAQAEPANYKIDPEHLSVGFLAEHIGYAKVLGMFREAEGSYVYDPETRTLSDLRVVIQTESVYSNHKKRDDHLRSPDFLNADEFPEMVFSGGALTLTGDNTGTLEGSLELLGQSNPVTIDVTLNKTAVYPFGHEAMTMGISARTSFKRSAYGMSYAVDNGWVGDEVEVILEFEAYEN
jgi:polyisoprenoid-binding protein YceI